MQYVGPVLGDPEWAGEVLVPEGEEPWCLLPPPPDGPAAAPHSKVLSDAGVVVTHGGHGTVIKALAGGRPCLVMPLGRDQPDNAARVVAHHAGIALRRSAKPPRIAAAVTRLLEDRSYAQAAGECGCRIRAEPGRWRPRGPLPAAW